MMKKSIAIISILFLFSFLVQAQLSLAEKRQMERFYNAGIEQLTGQNYLAALSSFDQCLIYDNKESNVYLQRGRVNAALGNYNEAMSDLTNAIQYDPDLGEAYFYKGYLMFGRDTTGESGKLLQMSLEKGFELAETYYYIGLDHLLSDEDDKALINFDKAIRMKDDYALAYHDRAGIKRRIGDFNGALYDYKTAVSITEHFPLAYNNMGSVKMVLGDFDGAIADFSKAIEQNPGYFLAYNNRGYAHYQLGKLDTAMVDFLKATELKPDFMEARLNKSSVFAKRSEHKQALELLNGIIEENPMEGALYLNRGLVKEMTGDVIGACDDWTKAFELGEERASEYIEECK
jgi:tetratricopeptide (TPR) repeat protein